MNTRKMFVVFLVLLLAVPLLSFNAFAADGIWGFMDVVGALWDTCVEVIHTIGGYFGDIKTAIIQGFDAIRGFFISIGKVISDAFSFLVEAIKRLFVPHSDYFNSMQSKIHNSFSKKFGGLLSVSRYLSTSFSALGKYHDSSDLLVISFPPGTFMAGTRFDLLGMVRDYLFIIRGALTGFVSLMTFAFAYKRVLSMINT